MDPVRILWVKANKLLPVHSGGDIRSYNILRQLATHEEVIFFSYYDGIADREYEAQLEQQLPGSVCVCTGKSLDTVWARGFDYLLHLVYAAPYAVSRFASPVVRKQLRDCISQLKPDVLVSDFLDAANNFPGSLEVPSVLFQHNVVSEIWSRHAANASNWTRKIVYRLEYSRMMRYEQATVRRFHHVIAVSDHDKKLMSRWVEPERITVVPTGVNIEEFCPVESHGQEKALVVFVGAMDWEPNIDAAEHFCADIWPLILAKVPKARFRIVGRSPHRRVKDLANVSIEVTGRVSSVVEHLREAAVVVVPLRVGGGTRLKIYEAMAVGKALVSTTIGAEGLDVHDGKDVILADSPVDFAESVVTLLNNLEARQRQGEAAAILAKKYGWPLIADKFSETLRRVVGKHSDLGAAHPVLTSAALESESEGEF